MRHWARAGIVAVLSCLMCPSPTRAQGTPISEILVKLIQADVRLAPPPPGGLAHDAHFIPGEQEKLAPYFFNQAILSQLTTFPLGSSSGGFSYSLDPTLGVLQRSTNSFGPAFAERALTIGRQKLNFGANYQHSTYDTFQGKSLDDDSIKFYLTHQPIGTPAFFFEGDIIEAALRLKLSTNTLALFANYGVTNRLDVGIAVPIVSVDMTANIDATVLRLATGNTGPTSTIHQFDNGTDKKTFSDTGSARGLGDVVVRAKYHFLTTKAAGGLAGGVDLRLPTGDEDNLLGSGATEVKLSLIGSNTYNKLAPHFNLGYTASGTSKSPFFSLADEFSYAIGTEFAGTPKLTITGDLLGRSLRNVGRLQEQSKTFDFMNLAGVHGSTTVTEFALQSGSLNLLIGAAGVKYNVWSNLLVSANVLFPLTKSGIRDMVTPVIGFDYAF